jgi:hypothetical protein
VQESITVHRSPLLLAFGKQPFAGKTSLFGSLAGLGGDAPARLATQSSQSLGQTLESLLDVGLARSLFGSGDSYAAGAMMDADGGFGLVPMLPTRPSGLEKGYFQITFI